MSKIIRGVLITLAYLISTIITAIGNILVQQLIYFIGYITIGVLIYKILKLSLQFLIKGIDKYNR